MLYVPAGRALASMVPDAVPEHGARSVPTEQDETRPKRAPATMAPVESTTWKRTDAPAALKSVFVVTCALTGMEAAPAPAVADTLPVCTLAVIGVSVTEPKVLTLSLAPAAKPFPSA